MSAETLERILNVTLSEPMLEGAFPPTTSQTAALSPAGCSSNVAHTPHPCVSGYSTITLPSGNYSIAPPSVSGYTTVTLPSGNFAPPSVSGYSTTVTLPPATLPPVSHYSAAPQPSVDVASCEPHLKRLKLDQTQAEIFPSEHDIDNFLDQIHQ